MSYRRRNRLRKGKRGITSIYRYGSRAIYSPVYNKYRRKTPEWNALNRAWVAFVIARSQDDYEKMRMYAMIIRGFERRLHLEINAFPDIGIYGFEEDFENKEEDDDSKLRVYDPWSRERTREVREDEDEDKEDEDDDSYRSLY